MSTEPEDKASHEPLWEQGSLLPAELAVSPLQWIHPDMPATKATRGVVKAAAQKHGELSAPLAGAVSLKQGDRLMLITQTCDIIKPAHELPQIEVARVFATANDRMVAQSQDFGSVRYFRVNDPAEEALILDYGQRALLDKGFLEAVKPDNELLERWSGDDRKKVARWLGQRYSRPAVPDQDYEQITRPVRDAWKTLLDQEPETAAEYNRVYGEWRYRRENDGSLTLYLLSPDAEPDPVLALEVGDFLTQAIAERFLGPINVATDHRSYHTFTKAEELATDQISMEWASHDEGDDAAMPS
jgi:hypothetical protein